jgi:hypothetical protein
MPDDIPREQARVHGVSHEVVDHAVRTASCRQ